MLAYIDADWYVASGNILPRHLLTELAFSDNCTGSHDCLCLKASPIMQRLDIQSIQEHDDA